jgi:phage replication-related protein YjqB (UPF0714/DUF867 family)
VPHRDRYASFAELARSEVEGESYRIDCVRGHWSSVAIIAPHGGKIEPRTGQIARAIASDDFNLYVFEGILKDDNYTRLHLTSHNFDEPQCLDLISFCDTVVAIHGCVGSRPEILLGGRDEMLKVAIRHALAEAAIFVRTDDHEFQGRGRENVCNRGRSHKGVQIELTRGFRSGELEPLFVGCIRAVLQRDLAG